MTKPELIAALRAARVVPVVRMRDSGHARTAIGWLRDAGVSVFEITMTIPDALKLMADLAREAGLIVGAGTVPDAATARRCLDAGARFVVAPWVDASLKAPCEAAGALLMLGATTPTEVRAALVAGADVVKIFPAASAGGPAHVKALVSVFPGVAFCPTGGVDVGNMAAYLAAGAAFVGVGGNLVDEARVAAGDRDAIISAARTLR